MKRCLADKELHKDKEKCTPSDSLPPAPAASAVTPRTTAAGAGEVADTVASEIVAVITEKLPDIGNALEKKIATLKERILA